MRRWRCTCLRSKIGGIETNIHGARGGRQLPHDRQGQDLHRVLRLHDESVGRIGYKVIFESITAQVSNRKNYS